MTVAEKIKNLRKRTGLSQGEMAARLEVSQALVSAWERGANVPRVPELVRLTREFGVTADYLLNEADERSPESLAAELRVREVAERIGWDAVYDRVLSLPPKAPAAGYMGVSHTGRDDGARKSKGA